MGFSADSVQKSVHCQLLTVCLEWTAGAAAACISGTAGIDGP